MPFPISWEVNVQVNYPGNSVWRKQNPSQVWFVRPVLLLSAVVVSTYNSSRLVINQSIKKHQKASVICKVGDLMTWTNEGRCCKITQLLLVSLRLAATNQQPSIACVKNVICHLHPKEASALKET